MYFLKKDVRFQNVFTKGLQLVMDMTKPRKCLCVNAYRKKVRDESFQVFTD
jgi:hypothetical protein